MASVFLVSEGSYSDYHIVAAFSTRRKAQQYVRQEKQLRQKTSNVYLHLNNIGIQEYALDSPPTAILVTWVYMLKDGTVTYIERVVVSDRYRDSDGRPAGYVFFDGEIMRTSVATEDEATAVKVANERRSMLLAADKWGTGGSSFDDTQNSN